MLRVLLAPVLLKYTGIALCIQLIWRTVLGPVPHLVVRCLYSWYGGTSLCPVLTSVSALYTQLIWRTITVPCTDLCYCVHLHLIWRTLIGPMYLHLVLRLHTADMADYHCTHVLTCGIAFTYIWYGGPSLCPVCLHLLLRLHTAIQLTITMPVYLPLVLHCKCTWRPRMQLLVPFCILQLQSAYFSLTHV